MSDFKFTEDDLEMVEGIVEFAGYMATRAEGTAIGGAVREMEKNWIEALDAGREYLERKHSVAVA